MQNTTYMQICIWVGVYTFYGFIQFYSIVDVHVYTSA